MNAIALISAWEAALTRPLALRTATLLEAAGHAPSGSLDVGRREREALRIHTIIAGDVLDGETTCARCDERMDIAMTAAALDIEPACDHEVACDDWCVVLRVPDTHDVLFALAQDDSEAALFARCVTRAERGGSPVQAADLPAAVRERCDECLDRLAPLANLTLDLRCPACGHADAVPIDIGGFVFERMAHWVEEQLDIVARLCRTYAWSEEHVLAMSPWRRRFYLARAEGA